MKLIAALLLSALATSASAQALHPVKIGQADYPTVLNDPSTKVTERNGRTSRNREMFLSADKAYGSGVYEAPASDFAMKSYDYNEYMYFISGGVTLTSTDGYVTEVKAGDAIVLPRGWSGRWKTDGYKKVYVFYRPVSEGAK